MIRLMQEGVFDNIAAVPVDGKPHALKTESPRIQQVCVVTLAIKGLGAYLKNSWVTGDGYLQVFGIAIWVDGQLKRIFYLRIQVSPPELPASAWADSIDYSFAGLLLGQVDDMLRVGRNLRSKGVEKEEKRISFPSIQNFNFAIVKEANDANVDFEIEHQGKRVTFHGSLAQLSDVTGALQTAKKWLASQTDRAAPQASTLRVGPARTPDRSVDNFVGKYPETGFRLLTDREVRSMGYAKARYALNEIYARHGYVFKDRDIQREFERWRWYRPRPGLSMDRIEREFSEVERANARLLLKAKGR